MFRFSLEAVLKQRQRQVETAQIALAEEARHEMAVKDAIKSLKANQEKERAELSQLEVKGLPVNDFLIRRWSLDGLFRRLEDQKKELGESQERLLARREALVEVNKKKKMVERLEEKARARYLEEERLAERKAIDEFAVLGFARRRDD